MKILIDVPDKQAKFGMEVLRSLSFVKKIKPFSDSAVQLWQDLTEAAKDIRLHKQGKLKLKTAQDLFNEL